VVFLSLGPFAPIAAAVGLARFLGWISHTLCQIQISVPESWREGVNGKEKTEVMWMEGGRDANGNSCEIKEHIDAHGGECLVTGRYSQCLECPYRNPVLSDENARIVNIDVR
jgi:hypothetical protein